MLRFKHIIDSFHTKETFGSCGWRCMLPAIGMMLAIAVGTFLPNDKISADDRFVEPRLDRWAPQREEAKVPPRFLPSKELDGPVSEAPQGVFDEQFPLLEPEPTADNIGDEAFQKPIPFTLPPDIELESIEIAQASFVEEPSDIEQVTYDSPVIHQHSGHNHLFAPTGPRHRGWLKAEYLLWSLSGFDTPALITSSPSGTTQNIAGVLGQPTTTTLFGGSELSDGARSGFRLSLGGMLDRGNQKSLEASYYFLGSDSDSFTAASSNSTIIARPFQSVEPGAEGQNAEFVNLPGILDGTITASVSTELHGGNILVRQLLSRGGNRKIGIFGGFRYDRLEDDLLVSDFKTALDASLGLAVGSTVAESDRLSTTNTFTGLVLGTDISACHRRWTVDVMLQLALGKTDSNASLAGSTTVNVPVAGGFDTTTTNTGLLVLQSNRGDFETDQFAMIPQLGIDLGFHLTRRWSAHLGYDFIYWSRVARAGELVDSELNLSQVAVGGLNGIASPKFEWRFTDMAIHAVDFGLNFRF